MADEQAIRARLGDDWPEMAGIECQPGKVGGAPCLAATRWPVNIWYNVFTFGYEPRRNADATDAYVLEGWSWLTPAQVATARSYVLAHLPLFDARGKLDIHDVHAMEALYRADCAALLALLDAARAVLAAVRKHLRCYDAACSCDACNEDRASKLPEVIAAYDALLASVARGAGGAGDVAASERGEG